MTRQRSVIGSAGSHVPSLSVRRLESGASFCPPSHAYHRTIQKHAKKCGFGCFGARSVSPMCLRPVFPSAFAWPGSVHLCNVCSCSARPWPVSAFVVAQVMSSFWLVLLRASGMAIGCRSHSQGPLSCMSVHLVRLRSHAWMWRCG